MATDAYENANCCCRRCLLVEMLVSAETFVPTLCNNSRRFQACVCGRSFESHPSFPCEPLCRHRVSKPPALYRANCRTGRRSPRRKRNTTATCSTGYRRWSTSRPSSRSRWSRAGTSARTSSSTSRSARATQSVPEPFYKWHF